MVGPVTVIRETRIFPEFLLSRQELVALCDSLLEALELDGKTFVLKLVDDGEMARLNKEFMNCVGPTNVLSFPAGEEDMELVEEGGVTSLGELALSVDALVREVDLYGQSPVGHLARLLAHGILHLAGYDHGDEMYDLTDGAVDRALLEYNGAYADDGES